MALIREFHNPFNPLENAVEYQTKGGLTIRQWLEKEHVGFVEFANPTVCFKSVNKQNVFILRKEWETYVIKDEDVISFQVIPGGPLAIFVAILVVLVVTSVVLLLTMPKPVLPGQQKQPESIYNLTGQQNLNRFGQPIEDNYGRNRLFPSYASSAYNEFDADGKQILYQLFCLGVGEYEIETEEINGQQVPTLRIGDTNVESFEGIEYAFYGPNENVTLFPDNVITAISPSGRELLGPNEDDYEEDVEGFTANDVPDAGTRIDIDIVLPNGLYASASNGDLIANTITATWEYAEIGSDDWRLLFNWSKTLATNDPQRFTIKTTVPNGNYKVRGNRTNDKDENVRSQNTLIWQAMRVFLPSTVNYGNVTILAIKAIATNNLNDNSQSRFNVVATRKLPIYNTTTKLWSAPTATRSISWADANVMKYEFGGRLSDSQLDLEGLAALDAIYTERGDTFDGQFSERITVWDAAKTIARVGRAIPMINGSLVTMIRDRPIELQTANFNQDSIVEGSFQIEVTPPKPQENDGIEITYVDEDTLREETVTCYFNGEDEPVNPEKITLRGCTVRRQAYQEGMYIYAQKRYLRTNLTIKTGMEGKLPQYGSKVGISHDYPRWAQGGRILSVDVSDSPAIIETSEPCRFGTELVVEGTVTASGNLTVTVTFDSTDIVVSVPVVEDDTKFMWASRVKRALKATSSISDLYEIIGAGNTIRLTPKGTTAYDSTLNIAVENGTCSGITNMNESNSVHKMVFRKKNGDSSLVYTVTPGESDYFVLCAELEDTDDMFFDGINETPTFNFGLSSEWSKFMTVVNIAPSSNEEVTLKLVNYDERIFAYDDEETYPVPALESLDGLLNPALPSVSSVLVKGVPNQITKAIVSWNPALGAKSYRIQTQVITSYGTNVTASTSDLLTKTAHGFVTGDIVLMVFGSGFGGLTSLRSYYVIFVSVDTFKLAKSLSQAKNGVAIDITSAGTTGIAIKINEGWTDLPSTNGTSRDLNVSKSFLIARVCGVNVGNGPWSYWIGQVGVAEALPGIVTNLSLANSISLASPTVFNSTDLYLTWTPAVGNGQDVSIEIYQTDGLVLLDTVNQGGQFFIYTASSAQAAVDLIGGGAIQKRELTIRVYSVNSSGTSTEYAEIVIENQLPTAVTGMSTVLIINETASNTYRCTWMQSQANDIKEYKFYAGATSGSLSLIDSGLFIGYDVPITKTLGAHAAHYWRVGVVDVWGNEIEYCAEQTIAAFP